MEWLIPSVIATLAGTLVLAAVFLFLYYQDRRDYLAIWSLSWGVYALRFVFQLWQITRPELGLLTILNQYSSLLSGLFLIQGTYHFVGRHLPRYWLVVGALISVWIPASTLSELDFQLISIPVFAFLGAIYVWTGVKFLGHPEIAGAGKVISGISFILWGLHKADYPFIRPIEWLAPWGYLFGSILELVVALGILMIYFQLTREEVRKSEARLKGIVENAAVGIGQVDQGGNYIQVNQALANMLRYSLEEMKHICIADISHPDDIEPSYTFLEQLFQGEIDGYELEKRFIRQDGSQFWAKISTSPIRDQTGLVVTAVAMIVDITERKNAEAALQRTNQRQQRLIQTAYQLNSSLDLEAVLEHIGQGVGQILDAYGVTIYLLTPDGQQLKPVLAIDPEFHDEIMANCLEIDSSLTGRAVKAQRGMIFNQPLADAASYQIPGTPEDPDERIIVTPFVANQQALGAMTIYRLGAPFTPADLELADTFGNYATAALKNAQAHADLQQAELALRESEQHLRTLIDQAPVGIVTVNMDGICTDINPRALELLGSPDKSKSLGLNVPELPTIKATGFSMLYQHVLQEGLPQDGENWYQSIWGKNIYMRARFVPQYDTNGNQVGAIQIFDDYSEQKQAEEDLRASEERFRLTFRISPDAININRLQDGLYVDVNEGFTALTGYSRQEVMGKTSFETNIWADPEDRDRLVAGLQRDGVVRNLEARFRLKDGRVRTGLMSATLLHLNGEAHIISITRDIEERIAAANALRESEARYRSMFEDNHSVMLIIQPATGEIVDTNPAACHFYGYAKADLTGMNIAAINTLPESELRAELNAALRDNRRYFLFQHKLANGDIRHVEVYSGPILQNGDELLFSIVHDITERVQREREMETIHRVLTALRSADNRAEILPVILHQVLEILQAHGASLALLDRHNGDVVIELAIGNAAFLSGKRLEPGHGLSGQIVHSGKPVVINDLREPDGKIIFANNGKGPKRYAGVPLVSQARAIGALVINRDQEFLPSDVRLLSAIGEIAANAIQRSTLFEETRRNLQRLDALHQIDKAITTNASLQATLEVVLEQVVTQLQIDAAAVWLVDNETEQLTLKSQRGLNSAARKSTAQALSQTYQPRLLEKQQIISLLSIGEQPFVPAWPVRGECDELHAYIGTPLIAKQELKGILELYHSSTFAPEAEWLNFLDQLARQTAIAVENAILFEDLQRSHTELFQAYDTTLEGWARALEMRDKETEGHAQRVVGRTIELARALGLGEENLVHIRRGALLHDIGKMAIPDRILFKPDKLSEEEWEIMRLHPVWAYDWLVDIPYLHPALDIPYCHHEKWDGTGYPRGLAGEEIPLAARIFAIIDVWDALSEPRPYRSAWPQSKILSFIESQSGTHFDPRVVEQFIATFFPESHLPEALVSGRRGSNTPVTDLQASDIPAPSTNFQDAAM